MNEFIEELEKHFLLQPSIKNVIIQLSPLFSYGLITDHISSIPRIFYLKNMSIITSIENEFTLTSDIINIGCVRYGHEGSEKLKINYSPDIDVTDMDLYDKSIFYDEGWYVLNLLYFFKNKNDFLKYKLKFS